MRADAYSRGWFRLDNTPIDLEELVTQIISGAEPWSAEGSGEHATIGVAVVHGFTGNPTSTRPLGERLAKEGYTVEVPLLPGHGTRWQDLAKTRYADWRGALQNTVKALAERCDRLVLVGLSMGGTLCMDVAAGDARVRGVVAMNAQVYPRTDPLARIAPFLQYVIPAVPGSLAQVGNDIAKPGADEGSYSMIPARAAQSFMAALPSVRDRLPALDAPTLIVSCDNDHTVDPENSAKIPGLIGGDLVETLRFERSYHVVTLDWDAEQLEAEVVRFVERVTA